MSTHIYQIKCYGLYNQELWSFVWIEGLPYGSMLQETNQWLESRYPFSIVPRLVAYHLAVRGFKLTFTVVV